MYEVHNRASYIWAFGESVKLAKAYLQKRGTTTGKCASSAESFQSVALLPAVIPQIVGRCCPCSLSFVKDKQMRQLLLTAIIAFATRNWAYKLRSLSVSLVSIYDSVGLRFVILLTGLSYYFVSKGLHTDFEKAYLQKKGTTSMKCASSAEANVFGQAVALCIAVISQPARRCHLPV